MQGVSRYYSDPWNLLGSIQMILFLIDSITWLVCRPSPPPKTPIERADAGTRGRCLSLVERADPGTRGRCLSLVERADPGTRGRWLSLVERADPGTVVGPGSKGQGARGAPEPGGTGPGTSRARP
jgi:hypothetical protein